MRFLRDRANVATPAAKRNAPKLRRALTGPEKRLWMLLRQRLPMDGTHFRRQVALGPYVADFVCLAAKMVIEVDGEQHGSAEALRYNVGRTTWLNRHGFTVMRFTNRQIMSEPDMVLDTVFAALTGQLGRCPPTPTPSPSPQAGGQELR